MYVSPEIVIGFHGCDQPVADDVIKLGGTLSNSENDYDWLGHGIYFWEGSHTRALEWARKKECVTKPAVVGAFIKLGNCLDLLDSTHLDSVAKTYQILKKECDYLGQPLPKNKVFIEGVSFVRELDCQVILRLQQLNNETIAKELELPGIAGANKRQIQHHPNFIDSVRGMFPEGKALYDGAGFRDKNHIQLCITNPNAIIGYFNPTRSKNSWYKNL